MRLIEVDRLLLHWADWSHKCARSAQLPGRALEAEFRRYGPPDKKWAEVKAPPVDDSSLIIDRALVQARRFNADLCGVLICIYYYRYSKSAAAAKLRRSEAEVVTLLHRARYWMAGYLTARRFVGSER